MSQEEIYFLLHLYFYEDVKRGDIVGIKDEKGIRTVGIVRTVREDSRLIYHDWGGDIQTQIEWKDMQHYFFINLQSKTILAGENAHNHLSKDGALEQIPLSRAMPFSKNARTA